MTYLRLVSLLLILGKVLGTGHYSWLAAFSPEIVFLTVCMLRDTLERYLHTKAMRQFAPRHN